MNKKVKIVLDADVIIHFAKGELLSALPKFLPEYEFIVLDKVKEEVHKPMLNQLQHQIDLLKNIREVSFGTNADEIKEYAALTKRFGKGESACMAYCHHNHDVVGSSNLRDITDYCSQNGIVWLTTVDFLHYGIKNGVINKKDAEDFVKKVVQQGSKLPDVDFEKYICTKL